MNDDGYTIFVSALFPLWVDFALRQPLYCIGYTLRFALSVHDPILNDVFFHSLYIIQFFRLSDMIKGFTDLTLAQL